MNLSALSRFFSGIATFFITKETIVVVTKDRSYIGFTKFPENGKPLKIVLSADNHLYDNVKEDLKELMIYGVLSHEILHQIYTPFDYEKKVSENFSEIDKKVFFTIANVVEDTAIENASPNIFEGTMLIALNKVIEHSYNEATGIDFNVPDGDLRYAYNQVINAFVIIGDRGPLKGEFKTKEAKECFEKCLPLFNEAVVEPNGKKRVDIVLKMYELIRPLVQENTNVDNNEDHNLGKGEGKDLPNSENLASGNSGSGSGNGNEQKEKGEQGKSGSGSEKDDKNAADGNKGGKKEQDNAGGNGSGGNGSGGSPKGDDDGGNNDADNKKSEEALNDALSDLKDQVSKAAEQIKEEEEAEKEKERKQRDDVPASTSNFHHLSPNKCGDSNIAEYDSIVSANKPGINQLSKNLQMIFKGDIGGKAISSHGSKICVKRVATPKLNTRILQNHVAPKNLSDLCINILVDESGSMMTGRKYEHAKVCCISLYEALASLNVPICISGFSTSSVCRGAAEERHYITWNSPKSDKYRLVNIFHRNSNYDYFHIKESASRLKNHPAEHKLMFVLSDGLPCSYYADLMPAETAEKSVKKVVDDARKNGIDVIGVAIMPDNEAAYAQMYGRDFIVVEDPSDLFTKVAKAVKDVVKRW